MHLKRLEIVNFRNYDRQVIEPDPLVNILVGRNAQGKTNILESIYFTCTGKSFRTAKEKEAVKWESDFSLVSGLFETKRRQYEVKVLIKPGQKRIEVNGVLARGYPLGWPGVVLFTPDDLSMIKGPPQERRRFLDFEIGPFEPRYSHYLGLYNRVISQRNNLLREIRNKKLKRDSLQIWNEQIANYGSKILFLRLRILKKLYPVMRRVHRELTGEQEELEIRYLSTLKIEEQASEEQIHRCFLEELKKAEKEEVERAQSIVGPHRDDLSVTINGADARIYGSQGQQRTILLTLKIAQIAQWKDDEGEYPVLLLDDVLFELDEGRRKALFDRVGERAQIFITSTGEENLSFESRITKKIYSVNKGEIFYQ